MSTIHDALKKVEKTMQTHNPDGAPTPPRHPNNPFNPPTSKINYQENLHADKTDPSAKKKTVKHLLYIVILFVLISAIIWLGPSSLRQLDIPVPDIKLSFLKGKASIPKPHTQPAPAPVKHLPPGAGPFLQGIMTIDGKNIALINNDPYEAGEMFKNMVITDISKNSVTLRNEQGEEKILRIAK